MGNDVNGKLFYLLNNGVSLQKFERKYQKKDRAIKKRYELIKFNEDFPIYYIEDGYTLLHLAALKGRDDIVKFLIKKGFDVNQLSRDGYTPLMIGLLFLNRNVIIELLESGCNVNIANKSGFTPLMAASCISDIDILKKIHSRDENINRTTTINLLEGYNGCSALDYAIKSENIYSIQYLLNNGACPKLANGDGKNALEVAEKVGNQSIVSLIEKYFN